MTANEVSPSDPKCTAILARLASREVAESDKAPTTSDLAVLLSNLGLLNKQEKGKTLPILEALKSQKLIDRAAPGPRDRADRWIATSVGVNLIRKSFSQVEEQTWRQIATRIRATAIVQPFPARAISAEKLFSLAVAAATEKLTAAALRDHLLLAWFGNGHDIAPGLATFAMVVPQYKTLLSTVVPPKIQPKDPLPPIDPEATNEQLLTAVKRAIPMIGDDGRFGHEKVFVSAIWHQIANRAPHEISFDDFKAWLLDANRKRDLDLARADLVGAMDAKLVADSEIRGSGTTFHFVLDHSKPRLAGPRAAAGRS